MFEQATLANLPAAHRLFGTFAGVTCQALFVGGLILGPLLFPQMLPDVRSMVTIVAPGPPPPPPAPGTTTVRPRAVTATRVFCRLCAPIAIPKTIARIVDEMPDIADTPGVPGGIPGGMQGGVPGGLASSVLSSFPALPPPPPAVAKAEPKPAAAAPAVPPRITGGMVEMASPIYRVEPQYPALARQMRVSGIVEIEAVVGVDGRLREIHVRSGPPLLVKAATDAVRQWVYKPSTLNGVPVEVAGIIVVTFRLN